MSSAPVFERAKRSQKDASARVSKLFQRHGRMVYGVCRAMLRDSNDAEDATQQAFLSAYQALLGGAEVRDGGAWMATIARNECRARIGASMRTPLPLTDDELASLPAPGDETERRQHAETLRGALAALPERQREAVVLRYLYGLRYGEVASALGLSRPATEALLFRARRSLRHRLRPAVATTIAVPVAVQEALAQEIPGFAVAGSGAALAGAAGGGILAKLTAAPIGAKVATAAVAVTSVGTIGAVESERAGRDRADRPAIVTSVSSDADEWEVDSAGSGPASRESEGRDDGRRGESDHDDDNSGPGSSGDEETSPAGRDEGSSSGPGSGGTGPGGASSDDDRSGSGGGGADGGSGTGDADDPVASPEDDSGPSGSPDGSSSGGSASSGSGDAPEDDADSGSSGPGGSGSGSSGSGEEDPADDGSSGSGSGEGVSSGSGSGDDDTEDD